MELGNMIFGNSRGNFPVTRDWKDTFCDFLTKCGFDGYGNVLNKELAQYELTTESSNGLGDSVYFENAVFIIRPYYWGEDDAISALPNFVYKPNGFELQWYKYPLRDSYSNVEITSSDLESMISDCISSLK